MVDSDAAALSRADSTLDVMCELGNGASISVPVSYTHLEEVVNGVCERCGSDVVQREKSQWMLKITAYAQRLIDDLDDVDFIERVKIQQRNWIGRSTGAEVTFKTNIGTGVTVYTTRADTLFGTNYMVISPEHPLLKELSFIHISVATVSTPSRTCSLSA